MSEDKIKEDRINLAEAVSPRASRLGPAAAISGEIRSDEDFIIEGQFQGNIDLGNQNLVIDKSGKVKADIRAKHVTISGTVEGNITASGRVFIAKEAQMKGDIYASRISIMEGAQFKGSIKMQKVPSVS
jgi:cytoskeletal protein CcmA (bactofilin family)